MSRSTPPIPATELPKILRARFRAAGIPLIKLAEMAGMPQSTCHALLRAPGRTTHPGIDGLAKLVHALGGELVVSTKPTTVEALRTHVVALFERSGHTRRSLYSPKIGAPRSPVLLWLSETATKRASVEAILLLARWYGLGIRIA